MYKGAPIWRSSMLAPRIMNTQVFQTMKSEDPERCVRLERLTKEAYADLRDLYGIGMTKVRAERGTAAGAAIASRFAATTLHLRSQDKRRAQLAQSLSQEVVVVPPRRLMSLVGQALKWQQLQGMLQPGAAFDLFRFDAAKGVVTLHIFHAPPPAYASHPMQQAPRMASPPLTHHRGTAQSKKDEQEMFPRDLDRTIKVGSKKSHPEVARFSPDGQALATGSVDGFIEVWDYMTGKLKTDLQYQAEEMFMMHDTPVLALAWSRDSELLASGARLKRSPSCSIAGSWRSPGLPLVSAVAGSRLKCRKWIAMGAGCRVPGRAGQGVACQDRPVLEEVRARAHRGRHLAGLLARQHPGEALRGRLYRALRLKSRERCAAQTPTG